MLNFSVISGNKVTSCQWQEVSALFSSSYGFYSMCAPHRAGERIRLGAGYYARSYATPDYSVAFCRDGESLVAEAYRCMPQSEQPWACSAQSEIDEILRALPPLSSAALIADFGAGCGRHLKALRERGFLNLIGIDSVMQKDADKAVILGDCRTWCSPNKCDVILCLYDVIGSYADEEDNKAILRNIAANLKPSGYAVISVSNFAYLDRTRCMEIDFDDPTAAAKAIFSLRPSRIMATSGEFFDPDYLLVDTKRHLVCHKEQLLSSENSLHGEYLIRDKRFTLDEIIEWANECGLNVTSHRFVRAGFAVDYAESDGKEILVVTRKGI